MSQALEDRLSFSLECSVRGRALGGTVASVRFGGFAWCSATGLNNSQEQTPLSISDSFLIYSLTKTFSAALILRLVAVGEVVLDDYISQYLSSHLDSVTVRQLLNHTAGVPDYGELLEYHRAVKSSPSEPWTYEDFLARAFTKGLDFQPGKSWHYSNTGYLLLRKLVEKVTGQTFAQAVDEHLLQPLGLKHTFVAAVPEDLKQLAVSHSTYLGGGGKSIDVRSIYDPGWVATGVLASNVENTTEFFHLLFTGKVLQPALLDQMKDMIQVPGDHPLFINPSYGLGIMADPGAKLGVLYGHMGEGPGYSAAVFHIHDLHGKPTTACALSNSEIPFVMAEAVLDLLKIIAE
jgi:D-alanyl-D-alanine carboxypeptidase